MPPIRHLAAFAALTVVLLLVAGCADSPAERNDESGVVFGRGSVPAAVPDSFPIPDEAVVGATLVDTNRDLVEMILTFPAEVDAVVGYYDENLPGRGYEITRSSGTGGEWVLVFSGEGIDGVIRFQAGGSGVSSASVRLTGF